MEEENVGEIRTVVREQYGKIASGTSRSESGCRSGGCCGQGPTAVKNISQALGYSQQDIESVPDGANLGLGCGNPIAIASLKPGDTVLDLGSGGGFDCFLAASQVGESGSVIGVDMTPEMLSKARDNAREMGAKNVSFRLGEIEHLPVADQSIDVIISNCVINLSPEKGKVYREAYRVLRPGGRLAITDVVAMNPLSDALRNDLAVVAGCVGGAETVQTIKGMLEEAGFQQINITPLEESRRFISAWLPGRGIEDSIVSATIEAVKPTCSAPAMRVA
jgi:SAM-dependent methyltransferase